MDKIAFCFLTYNNIERDDIWRSYLENNMDKCSIYIHSKTKINDEFFGRYELKMKTRTYKKTDILIVYATYILLSNAYMNEKNKKIIFLSQSCIPIIPFNELYEKIMMNDNSYIKSFNKNCMERYNNLSKRMKGLIDINEFTKQQPNMILDRRDVGYLLKNNYMEHFKMMICPDEHYFINILRLLCKRNDDIMIKDQQICFCNYNEKRTQGVEHKNVKMELIKILRYKNYMFMRKISKKTIIEKDFMNYLIYNNQEKEKNITI